jgi:DNA-binding CsgD family transcriptional regulator
MNLKAEDWKAINGCLLRLYRELDVEKHRRLMLEIVTELVPGESAVLSMLTFPNKLTYISQPEKMVTDADAAIITRFAHESPLPHYFAATQDSQWKMITDFMPLEDFHATDLYRHGFAPYGIDQQIGGLLAMAGDTHHAITIHRRLTSGVFTEREREILNTLRPHLVTSYLNATAYSRAGESINELKATLENAPGAYGYFNADGKLAWLQEKATAWLQEFFADEVKTTQKIPQSVSHLLKASLADDNASKQFEKTGAKEILNVSLGVSPLGGRVLRLERRPKTPPPHFRPLPQFTERKNDVLKWMVEGKRNAEIAAILHLSPRTVERHITEILVGLNVENRATAIVRALEFCAAENMKR